MRFERKRARYLSKIVDSGDAAGEIINNFGELAFRSNLIRNPKTHPHNPSVNKNQSSEGIVTLVFDFSPSRRLGSEVAGGAASLRIPPPRKLNSPHHCPLDVFGREHMRLVWVCSCSLRQSLELFSLGIRSSGFLFRSSCFLTAVVANELLEWGL
ncbi:hypothetical protein MLD38_002366 [Melastoma candidum]|uniref:Uncharacterized protein n=1 Tax=Melastoma candidum TaxID=119954 RepID=A0ACB9RYS5_9MYRT|nr:hypothetical protein MLD38_002366 [Melastoma candidum]